MSQRKISYLKKSLEQMLSELEFHLASGRELGGAICSFIQDCIGIKMAGQQ